jgi:hypothetical protein
VSDNPYRSSLCAHVTMGTEPHEVMMTDCADGTYLFSRHWRVCSGVLLRYVQQIRVFTLQLSAERMAILVGKLVMRHQHPAEHLAHQAGRPAPASGSDEPVLVFLAAAF